MSSPSTLPSNQYRPFRFKHVIQLAAPQTWAASVMPVLFSFALTSAWFFYPSWTMTLVLLVICVLMQSSVNTFNDYFDFVHGLDTEADQLDADDSTLVNDRVNPRSALVLAIVLLALAFVLGIYVIINAGIVPLVIALVGGVVVFLYSGGKTPLSSLPLGEVVSGVVMGCLMPVACVYVLSRGYMSLNVVLLTLPFVIGIGLIMMTNNTCDIEKDKASGRKTLPVVCTRPVALVPYHVLLVVWVVAIIVFVSIFFLEGVMVLPFMILACFPLLKALWKNPLTQQSRIGAMGQICSVNIALGSFYCLCMLL